MSLEITWLKHASFRLASKKAGIVVYTDPWKIDSQPHDADVVFISHDHFDHCSPQDVRNISKPDGAVIGPADVTNLFPSGKTIAPGQSVIVGSVTIEAVPAYNIGKTFHPKANGWCGAVISLADQRVYYAGDTDLIPEMKELHDIDLALLPIGGTYTMTAEEAAQACKDIGCSRAIPCHWGEIIGQKEGAKIFAALAPCPVTILQPGQTFSIAN